MRVVRTGGAGQLAPGAPRIVRTCTSLGRAARAAHRVPRTVAPQVADRSEHHYRYINVTLRLHRRYRLQIAPSIILCESHRSSTSPVLAAGWHTWRFCARVAAGCVVARRKARWVAPRHGHLVITPSAEPQWQRLSSPPVPPLAALRSAALPEAEAQPLGAPPPPRGAELAACKGQGAWRAPLEGPWGQGHLGLARAPSQRRPPRQGRSPIS